MKDDAILKFRPYGERPYGTPDVSSNPFATEVGKGKSNDAEEQRRCKKCACFLRERNRDTHCSPCRAGLIARGLLS